MKKPDHVTLLHFGGVHAAKKGWLGGHFSELGFAGSRAHKPRREFEGSTLEPFFHVFLSLNGVFIV